MSMPFYVSPEQLMKDRADYARKGIARGRSVIVLAYDGGIAFVSENPSRALHKVSEIYDRIAFAAVGKYNEFENLRVAGIRYADLRGYSYDRSDVTARGLANAYAQTLGTVFTQESKPYEVEIVVAQVDDDPAEDQIGSPMTAPSGMSTVSSRWVARPSTSTASWKNAGSPVWTWARCCDWPFRCWGRTPTVEKRARCPPISSRSPSWTGPGSAASSGASPGRCSTRC